MQTRWHGISLASSAPFTLDAPAIQWQIATEVPVAFVYNRHNYAIMMATPDDLEDFAIGFSLSENVIKTPTDILSLDIYGSDKGVDLRFKLSQAAQEHFKIVQNRRQTISSAGCGLCGLENAERLFAPLPKVAPSPQPPPPQALRKALQNFADHQQLNRRTYSVHGAAWVNHAGDILITREDVGRHNALDKLLGRLARTATDMQSGFVILSSRCAYEMVEKAAYHGVQTLLCISSPTLFALKNAKTAHMAIFTQSKQQIVRLI